MGRTLLAFLALLLLQIAPLLNGHQKEGESFLSLEARIQDVFNGSRSSVVRVKAAREQRVDNKVKRFLKMGSGFFISKEAHVLTTGLLDQPDRIWIEYDNSYFLAEKIGHDPLCNISLLQLSSKPKNFTFISFPEPGADLKIGSILIGISCALEFKIAPTYGIMQSHEFSFGKSLFPTKMIRSSLPLGLGEVGAPVFDLRGRFIGITYTALPDLRSSFLLPANACSRIRDDLLLSGKVNYGWFGIMTNRKLNVKNGFDILVDGFVEGSPGAESKLQKGDLLKEIGETVIRNRGDLANASFFSRPGTFVEFLVDREGKELTIPVKVGDRPFHDPKLRSEKDVTPNTPSLEGNKTSESPGSRTLDLNKTVAP